VSGTKFGYAFEAAPSTTEPCIRWHAKATPLDPGARSLFTNQVGIVYASRASFTVDARTCEAPKGLLPIRD